MQARDKHKSNKNAWRKNRKIRFRNSKLEGEKNEMRNNCAQSIARCVNMANKNISIFQTRNSMSMMMPMLDAG